MRRVLALLAAGLVVVIVAACGADDDTVAGDDGDATTTTASTTTTTFPGGTTAVSQPPPDDLQGTAHLVDVRVATHPDEQLARVTFEFDSAVPGYEVEPAEPPFIQDGSGMEVQVPGDAFLRVRMQPASRVDLTGDEADLIYEGPDRVTGDAGPVVEVALVGDFEALMEWAVGLDQERRFHVYALQDPPRLVIDVASG